MAVKKTIKLIWEYFKINLQSAMEYRTSFLTQAGFMFINDITWVIFWVIFFNKFPLINTWSFKDLMLMYVVITTSWGLVGAFFGNFRNMAEIIRDGQLDFYLALPKEELSHVLVSKSKLDAFGDLLFGIVLGIIFLSVWQIPLAVVLIILSAIILIAFAVILSSLSFYMGSSVEIANQGQMGILSIASYPFSVYTGYVKWILLLVIPAGFVSGVPVELIKSFSWQWFGGMILAAIILSAIALIMFKKGVKRYESGNLINIRV
ncbi:MAG: ABC-2 family transporter protein [Candidatus Pacearchaeota archaeon]